MGPFLCQKTTICLYDTIYKYYIQVSPIASRNVMMLSYLRLWHPLVVGKARERFSALHRLITKDVKNGSYCCYVRCETLIVRVGGMPWSITRHNSLPCTVMASQTKVVQSKGWLSVGRLAA